MPITGKRILITGGAGFIGSHLAQRLVDANEVVLFDTLQRNAIRFAPVHDHPNLRIVQGDIMDGPAVQAALEGCHILIHCAAIAGVYSVVRNSIMTMEINLMGTHRVLQAAAKSGVERLVHFSTSEVYGPFTHKAREEDANTIGSLGEPRWVYAASKLASEHLAYAYAKEYDLPLVIVRPFNVYGPRQVGEGAVRALVLRAIADEPILLYNDGTQIRAWCFVDDFVDGILRCLERPEAVGQVFNIGNPQGTITNLELARMIVRLSGSRSTMEFKPHPGPEVEMRVPSIEKAGRLLGFTPTVSLEQGVAQAIEWYRSVQSMVKV